jgi:hypothetical protein
MTEPTHHYRRDVESQLDNLLRLIPLQVANGAPDEARRDLRAALSAAWSNGCIQGLMHIRQDPVKIPNPYDEMDMV